MDADTRLTEPLLDGRAEIKLLREALHASEQMASHMHQVFGGWEECPPCEKANDECDGDFACDAYKGWRKAFFTGLRSRAEVAVDRLNRVLAERDEQIAYLLAAEPTLDDDQPGAPR